MKPFSLECVVTCVDYSDFLEVTLPETLQHVDRLVVVTSHEDKATRDLCRKWSVDCVATDAMNEDDEKFNKGRGINLGLGHLRGLDWVLHLDADIVLPHGFRGLLSRAKLKKENLYGADRVNVYGYEHWEEHKHKLTPHFSNEYFVQPPAEFPLGARIIHKEIGWCPIGYFQLWHKTQGKRYTPNQGNAEHSDVLFAAQWARANRVILPEVVVYHLDSMNGPTPMGANWNGRKTPLFRPKKPKCSKHHHQHGCHCHPHHHHHKKYCP